MGKGLGVLQGVHYTWEGEGSTTVVRTTYNWIALGSTCKALTGFFAKRAFFGGPFFSKAFPKKKSAERLMIKSA
jgi:uncharacterized integral membrane protein